MRMRRRVVAVRPPWWFDGTKKMTGLRRFWGRRGDGVGSAMFGPSRRNPIIIGIFPSCHFWPLTTQSTSTEEGSIAAPKKVLSTNND
jgi:hypothetical protein